MPAFSLEQMTVEEKIRAMEAIWDDLCRNAERIAVPEWHRDVLAEREAAVERGEGEFEDWETAKEGIRREIT